MTAKVFHRERVPKLLLPFVEMWEQAGDFDLTCTSGARTDADQLVDWAKGRALNPDGSWKVTHSENVVTYARTAADSAHGHDAAADFHPVRSYFANGLPATIYTGGESGDAGKEANRRFFTVGLFAESLGFEWGGRFPHFDGPHIQVKGWRALPIYQGAKP